MSFSDGPQAVPDQPTLTLSQALQTAFAALVSTKEGQKVAALGEKVAESKTLNKILDADDKQFAKIGQALGVILVARTGRRTFAKSAAQLGFVADKKDGKRLYDVLSWAAFGVASGASVGVRQAQRTAASDD